MAVFETDFCDHTARYFVETLLGRNYEPAADSRNGFGAIRFDPWRRACWSPRDPLALRVLREQDERRRSWPWLAAHYGRVVIGHRRLRPLFTMDPAPTDGVVFFPSSDAVVVVVMRERRVWKVSKADSPLASLLVNEVTANELAPLLAPQVVAFRAPDGEPGYVATAYVQNDRPVQRSEWPSVLRQIQGPLVDMYEAAGITIHPPARYLDQIHRRVAALNLGDTSSFDREAGSLLERLVATAERWRRGFGGDIPVPETFVHGDLVRDNVRRSGDRLTIIDWGNGGRRHLIYDLFMQEFYRPHTRFWRSFPAPRLADYEDAFHGWSGTLLPALEKLLHQRVTAQVFNFHILCCAIERSLLTVQRYRRRAEHRGLETLRLTTRTAVGLPGSGR